MKQTYYVVEPFEIFSQEELEKAQKELSDQGRHVVAMVFDCSSHQECSDRYFKKIGM